MTFTNDIALVKLNRKVRFTDKVQPIKLPKGGFSYEGYQAYVSGWGIQSPYEGPSSVLKGAELVVSLYLLNLFISITQCPEINFNKISNTIHKNYIGFTSMLQGFQKCIA